MKIINTKKAATPLGHYSQATVHNNIVYVSGQLPIDPDNSSVYLETVEEQTQKALENLEAILIDANSGKEHVLKTTIYISDISIWAQVNDVYATFFGEHKPARSAVPTKNLPKGYLVEIEAIATLKDN